MNSENKYKNAKIYSIRCSINDDLIYIGSTCQLLYKRWYDHKRDYKNDYFKNKPLYIKMNDLGVDLFYIELIINCPCENKEELHKIEGYYIRKYATLNKRIAGRTNKIYYEDNKDQILEHNKEYRQQNKDKIKEKDKERYNKNKEGKKQKQKEYYSKNIEEKKQKQKEYYLKNKEEKKQKQKEYYLINKKEMNQKNKEYYLKKKLEKEQII